MNKSALSFCLAIVTIALIAFSVYLAIKGDKANATYLLVWALTVSLIVKPMVS